MNRHERRRRATTRPAATTRKSGLPGLVAGAVVLLLLAGAYVSSLESFDPSVDGIGGRWTLTSSDGRSVTDRDFRGRYVLLYFGYTSCPHVCPTTLAAVADALRRLGHEADRLQPVFITVDPQHDTPSVVGDYVRAFSAQLVGLTGSPSQIATVEHEYHVHSSPMTSTSASGARMFDHTAVLLLIGPDGRFLAPFPPDESGQELAIRLHHDLV